MAIWDKTDDNEKYFYSATETVKCPGCGSNLFYDIKLGKMICYSCGGAYDPDTLELSYRMEDKDVGDADVDDKGNHEIICNSCGAVVVTEQNTISTYCAFCGSPTLVTKRLSRKFSPDYIIPFKITKDEAKTLFKEFVRERKYAPSKFRSKAILNKFTGLYVPFWMIDGTCHMDVVGEGHKYTDSFDDKYSVELKYDFKLRGVPFDGSKAISNRLMEAIEPYDYNELKPFTNAYLPGFYAERYDQSALDMSERIAKRMTAYSGKYAEYLCSELSDFRVVNDNSYPDELTQKYALLPVWLLNYEYNGRRCTFAINGQTGEVDGDMPVSKWRRLLKEFGFWSRILLPVAAVVGLIAWIVAANFEVFSNYMVRQVLPIAVTLLTVVPAVIIGFFIKDKRIEDMLMMDSEQFHRMGRAIDRYYYRMREKHDNLGNEINMLPDDIPDVEQYYERISGNKPEKTVEFIGRALRNESDDRPH